MNDQIFDPLIRVSKNNRKRLVDAGYLRSWNNMNKALMANPPSEEDLKMLIMLELERETPRLPILDKFIVRLQKRQREALFDRIKETPGGKRAIEHSSKLA